MLDIGWLWPREALPIFVALALIATLETALFLPLAAHRPFDGHPIDWAQWRRLSGVEMATAVVLCPPSIPGQSVTVAINGRVIATLDGTAMSGARHLVAIPDDVVRRPVNTIDLIPARRVTVTGDDRQLSFLLAYIGLESAR